MNPYDDASLFKPLWICHDDEKREFLNAETFNQATNASGPTGHRVGFP